MPQKTETTPEAEVVFEVSWEVGNKVGGIYTVVSSKALQMIERYGENYYVVGPYFPRKAQGVFEEHTTPETCKPVFEELKKIGIDVRCGKWLVKGNPNCFLVDFSNYTPQKNNIKRELWDAYKIDSLYTEYFDYDEPIIWGYAVGKLIEALSKGPYNGKKIVAQCHEWLAAGALLYTTMRKLPVATVFTTHATVLGRAMASDNINIYENISAIKPEEEARKRGPSIIAKYQTEKASAHNANVFTTVSEITGIEATQLLNKKPDVILPNGLDMEKFPTFEQASVRHKLFKNRIKTFLIPYFFPYYSFDLDDTLIYFLAGRYEFKDKGIDVFIRALAILNETLKREKCNTTVIAFIWVPGNVRAIRSELLENKSNFLDIKDTLEDEEDEIHRRILHTLVTQKPIAKEALFGEDTQEDLKRKLAKFTRKTGLPPLSTHELYNEDKDAIINALKSAKLLNRKEDRVKVIFYPIYLSGADGLLDVSYYESMQGSHLGVFPSFYEPWGYTPLEAAALAVSSVTTDLSGFGRYLCTECVQQPKIPGIFVLRRMGKTEDETVKELAEFLARFAHFSPRERIENKIAAKKLAETADWKHFSENYVRAHNQALKLK
jgi:glycogen synthase